jgi:hypothetical protein
MADEPVAVGGAGAGAGTGGGSGDGGAGGGAGAGSPTPATPAAPAAPAAPQTDEQILGMDPVGTAPAEAAPVVQQTEQEKAAAAAKATADAAKTPEQLATEQAAKATEDKAIPAKWQELAKTDPEFRTLYFTAKTNADKLATIEPQFLEAQTKIAEVAKLDEAMFSGDPTSVEGGLRQFLGEKSEALAPMFEAGLNLLKTTQPQAYEAQLTKLTTETLHGWQFDKAFEVLRNALDAGEEGLPTLKAQVQKMLEFADGNGFPTTEKARVEARARGLDAREAGERTKDEQNFVKTSNTFRDTVNSKITESVQGEIKTAIGKLLEKTAFTPGAQARIAADAHAEINKLLAQKTDIVDQIGKAIWPNGSRGQDGKPIRGVFSQANSDLAIKLPVEFAKTVLNDVLQKVVETYTTDFMASYQTAEKRRAAAAGKTEVSGASPAPRGQRALTRKDVDYSKMSDQDILDA